MTITLVKTLSSLNPAQGRWSATAIITVTGLTQGATNTFSLTADGSTGGTALLPSSSGAIKQVGYVPTDTVNLGGWAQAAPPTVDANGNIVLAITVAATGPESFSLSVDYPVPMT
jgi:hypothetical protein